MFRSILVPLDGSPLAEAALPHAAALAAAFDARIHLLRVIPIRQRGGAVPLDIIDRKLGQAEVAAYLQAVAADLRRRDIAVQTEVLEGHPAEQILEVLRGRQTDLLVLTSHGCGGLTEFRISGTAHKVISGAGVSILLVPTSETRPAGDPTTRYHRILVGLDGSRRSQWGLGPATVLARAVDAELVLAHIVQVPETVEDPGSMELRNAVEHLVRLNQRAAMQHLGALRARLSTPGLKVRTRIEVSRDVSEALATLAEAEHADLVVLTAHGVSVSSQRAYGVIATQLLAHARRPLLIAQDTPRRPDMSRTERAARRATAVTFR